MSSPAKKIYPQARAMWAFATGVWSPNKI